MGTSLPVGALGVGHACVGLALVTCSHEPWVHLDHLLRPLGSLALADSFVIETPPREGFSCRLAGSTCMVGMVVRLAFHFHTLVQRDSQPLFGPAMDDVGHALGHALGPSIPHCHGSVDRMERRLGVGWGAHPWGLVCMAR